MMRPATTINRSRAGAWLASIPVELVAAFALGALYFAIMSGHLHSIDGLVTYRQAESIAYEGSLHFSNPLWPGAPWMTSRYGIGLSLLYVPGLLLWSWLHSYTPMSGAVPFDWPLYYNDPYYAFAAAPVHILITVVAAYLVVLVCRELGLGRTAALWGLAIYALGSPAIVYSKGDWGQQLAGLCWIASIFSILRYRRTGRLGALVLCGAALCYGLLARPFEGLLICPVVFVMLTSGLSFWKWSLREWRSLVVAGGGAALGIALTMLINWGRFGSLTDFGYNNEGAWTTPLGIGLAGALVSPGRGILWEFPAVLLSVLGVVWLRRTRHRKLCLLLVALVCVQLINVAAWNWWWGGWNFGLRLFVPALPILAVLAACGIKALPARARSWIPGLLLLAGIVWAVPCVLTDLAGGYGETYNGTPENFRWDAYPPVGAWQFLRHHFATSSVDRHGVDIVWFRLARETGNLSLVPMALLLLLAMALAVRVLLSRRTPVKVARHSQKANTLIQSVSPIGEKE